MALWGLFSLYWIIRLFAKKNVDLVNDYLYDAIPSVFTTLGVLGTFTGIYYGLQEFDTTDIDGSIQDLLDGLKSAFITSIWGIFLSLIFGRLSEIAYGRAEAYGPVKATDELSALRELIELSREGKTEANDNLKRLNTSLIGESDASVATQLIKLRNKFTDVEEIQNQQADTAVEIRDALGGNDDTSLLSQVQRLRAEQKEAADSTGKVIVTVMETMTQNSQLLHQKFDEFADLLAKNNTEALVDVMRTATEQFQAQMKDIIEKLVQENFAELNNSVERMNTWQQENKAMITQLTSQFSQVSTDLQLSATTMQEITTNTVKLTDSNSVLTALIQQLKAVMIDDVRFQDVTTKLLDNATLLKANTEAFDETTGKLNEWVRDQYNFREGVAELINRLDEVAKIKGYSEEFWNDTRKQMKEGVGILNESSRELNDNLDNISETFTGQLNETLTSLDTLIQRIIKNYRD
jgi:hypothetical protein